MIRFSIVGFLLLVYTTLSGQFDSVYVINQVDLENIVENQELEDDLDVINTMDELANYIDNPLDLNSASYDDLYRLQLLHDYQITAFIEYRQKYGNLLSSYELQAIPGWNILTIERVLPFVQIGSSLVSLSDLKTMATSGKHQLFLKWKRVLSDRAGFAPEHNPNYLGDPNHLFTRYHYNFNNRMRWGFTAEKDPGEQFFQGINGKGFDFYSAFFFYKNPESILRTVSLGDYSVSMGQGLIMHNSFGSGKSSQVINIVKGGSRLRPYSSVNEALFMRGAAVELGLTNNISFTTFYSRRHTNGNSLQDTTIDTGFGTFSSIITNGYHRTENEAEKKGTILQENAGGILEYQKGELKVAANYLYTHFNKNFELRNDLYRKFAFQGNTLKNYSVDFTYRYENFNFFGEWARSGNGAQGYLAGLQSVLHPQLDVAMVYRNYEKDYQVLNPNPFGESSTGTNERGLYFAINYRLNKNWGMSFYHDFWNNPWLRFRVDGPGHGTESFIRIDHNKKRKYNFYIQYKYENKSENLDEDQLRSILPRKLHRLRLHFANQSIPHIELRNRVEYVFFEKHSASSTGWLIYQDLIFRPKSKPYSMTTRLALFHTDDFNSRIYAYENDILYEFRIPFYQNKGLRYYVNMRYKVNRSITAEFRYEHTKYLDRETIGSSGEEINGPIRNEIKCQIKYQF